MSNLVTDELWSGVEPLLPKHPPSPKGGRKRCDDRNCLEGILFVLRGGNPWHMVPREIGASPSSCWRRFHEWTVCGVWDELHRKFLRQLGERDQLDTDRSIIDSASVRALKGGRTPALIRPIAANQAVKGT
jgi:transposase